MAKGKKNENWKKKVKQNWKNGNPKKNENSKKNENFKKVVKNIWIYEFFINKDLKICLNMFYKS